MIDSMKRGDQVITSGGIHGTVVDVRDDTVVICISKGVNIKVSKPSIANVQSR
jgi:preprotein translocase subunit YajC